ncbi:MAG: hypothetical protein ACRCZQ_07780 [Bacteroidales bacterium]
MSDGKSTFKVAVPGGYLTVTSLQIAGKKRMGIEEFLRGFRFAEGLIFE